MKNIEVFDFLQDLEACDEGYAYASKFPTMHDVYEDLLKGGATHNSVDWAMWVLSEVYDIEDLNEQMWELPEKLLQMVRSIVGDEAVEHAKRHLTEPYSFLDSLWTEREASATVLRMSPTAKNASKDCALRSLLCASSDSVPSSQVRHCLFALAWQAIADKYPDYEIFLGIDADENTAVLAPRGYKDRPVSAEDAKDIPLISVPLITPEVQEPFLSMLREIGNPFEKEIEE